MADRKLSAEKQALLRRRLQGRGRRSAIPLRTDGATAPVSALQRGLWFLEQLQPGNAAYHIPSGLRLKGALDRDALHRALQQVVARHEALRTTLRDGVQVIAPELAVGLPVLDVAESDLARVLEEEIRKPFDLVAGPLIRAVLLRLADDDHLLYIATHHVVSDGWSTTTMNREIAALYEGAALPEPPLQYGDYSQWQADEDFADHVAYWRERLAGAPALLELPTDRPRPAVQGFRGACHNLTVPAAALKDLARRENATLYMTLFAAFLVLLHRYTRQDDISIGTPTAGRGRPELEDVVGMFVNMVVMRSEITEGMTYRDLLAQVREASLEAISHDAVPFETLVTELQPEQTLSHNPFFQVMFNLLNFDTARLDAGGLEITPLELHAVDAQFDLGLNVTESGDELSLELSYRTDLFDAATIERLGRHLCTLLAAVVADPDQPIGRLEMLPADERRLVLETWNDTARDLPVDSCLHELIEAQVRRTPDAVALVFADEVLTYAGLNARANRLAHRLRELGVGPETLVGVCMERSLELVVALCAVLKAGGAYVPLDPDYPPARLAFMIEDSGAPVVLTQARFADALPTRVIAVDAEDLDAYPAGNPESGASPTTLAYMIYTSGSTGEPKGALNEHRGIVNRLLWGQETFGLAAHDVIVQKTPFTFDVSVWEFFWPLIAGARLVVAAPGGHRDPAYISDLVRAQGVTTIHFVPSMLQLFLGEPTAVACTGLQRVLCSGEALDYELQQRFFERLGSVELHNLYGPTEAAVEVSHWRCRPDYERPVVPMGVPIANTKLYVLDGLLQPVPPGVPGELHIGGVQVARGYHNRPELTARCFVDVNGERLYRTGDLVRWLPDGNIEFLGRVDFQVKLRGFRIELGEIESVLRQQKGVSEAVVVLRDERLVGYVVGEGLAVPALRRALSEKLADYMVPGALVVLDAMPLNPNGKVDRRALPAPTDAAHEKAEFVAPRTGTERALAAMWEELLGIERVGAGDDFFLLGGHSLLATRLLARIRDDLGAGVALATVFEARTIAELAVRIDADEREEIEL